MVRRGGSGKRWEGEDNTDKGALGDKKGLKAGQ